MEVELLQRARNRTDAPNRPTSKSHIRTPTSVRSYYKPFVTSRVTSKSVELPIFQVGPSQLYCDPLQVTFHSFGIDKICCGNLNNINTIAFKLLAYDAVDLSPFGITVDTF